MPIGEWRPVPKPNHGRSKKTAKERGQVTPEIYEEAAIRARWRCERCGRSYYELTDPAWSLEAAHVDRRWKSGADGITADDILILCGPQVNTGTCHHWADHTRAGRDWMIEKREEIRHAKSSQEAGGSGDWAQVLPGPGLRPYREGPDAAALPAGARHDAGGADRQARRADPAPDGQCTIQIEFQDGLFHIREPL